MTVTQNISSQLSLPILNMIVKNNHRRLEGNNIKVLFLQEKVGKKTHLFWFSLRKWCNDSSNDWKMFQYSKVWLRYTRERELFKKKKIHKREPQTIQIHSWELDFICLAMNKSSNTKFHNFYHFIIFNEVIYYDWFTIKIRLTIDLYERDISITSYHFNMLWEKNYIYIYIYCVLNTTMKFMVLTNTWVRNKLPFYYINFTKFNALSITKKQFKHLLVRLLK